ncbi:WD40 repeat domain-containing protein [Treponema sp. HNW]|uniref:hypothetical protein n=1 Tax=Treponema sp. HNW TaxID=3116654 RepID=UPI003D0F34F7
MNTMYKKSIKKLLFFYGIRLIICSGVLNLSAQVHISSHPHAGSITAAVSSEKPVSSFSPLYTAAEDGFIIKWTDIENGEHFQISDNAIQLIALHPNGEDIAVYETDGFSLNRISLWNWPSQSRIFAKRLNGAASSLSFSAKGNYLFIGMSNMEGIICMDAQNGSILSNKIEEQRGAVSFAVTSASENTCIMYSPLGSLIYTDLKSGTEKMSFSIQSALTQHALFYNNVLFAGVKNNGIYVFRADTGEQSAFIAEKKPLLCTASSDKDLYYLDISGKNAVLKVLETENGYIKASPLIVKSIAFPQRETPIFALKTGTRIYTGTKSGQVYTFDIEPDSQAVNALPVSKRVYDKIYDIAEDEGSFYFLTEKSVFKTSYENATVYSAAKNTGYTNLTPYKGGFILWSKNSKKAVVFIGEDKRTKTLFTPALPLHALHIYYDKIVMVEGNTRVKIYDLQTGTSSQPYTGTGIQDVLLYSPELLFAAKSAAGNPKTALVHIDTATKETAAAVLPADIAFSLSPGEMEGGPFYGAALTASKTQTSGRGKSGSTEIFAFYPQNKQYSPIFKWADEDSSAFTMIKNGVLFTNVGKTHIHAYDIAKRKDKLLERTASLPAKIAGAASVLTVLNRDGSISWYDASSMALLKSWYITLDGEWLEF